MRNSPVFLLDCYKAYYGGYHGEGYCGIIGQMPESLLNMHVHDITTMDVQKEINWYSKDHSPRSIITPSGISVMKHDASIIDLSAVLLPTALFLSSICVFIPLLSPVPHIPAMAVGITDSL